MTTELAKPVVETAIDIKSLRKEFRVYRRSFGSLKTRAIATALAKATGQSTDSHFDVRVALKDVSLTIPRGQTIAVVGRNGSGKSTLFSILARIYLPTSGEAIVHGRLIALLELGAGFDPDLTGNQNLIFNAAILGLSQEQIKDRYEAICEFAGLDQSTMNLPVRMYSSGMQLRLGFAIATNLDADIILVDEGLAVGDEAFQEKCFRKIEEFKASGRTIFIVSHELDHIERLADRVVWLDKGVIKMDGDVPTVLKAYRDALMSE
jgi:ABC-type polysaccharide/polyol phosphate transport system ATPase subunit